MRHILRQVSHGEFVPMYTLHLNDLSPRKFPRPLENQRVLNVAAVKTVKAAVTQDGLENKYSLK
jgi:hypothetical protein